jgi:prepilin-type processing-associated H-X9-DG protein
MRAAGAHSLADALREFAPYLLVLGLVTASVAGVGFLLVTARARALQGSCLANMKSLALCTLEYASDWNDRLPPRPATLPTWSLAQGVGAPADLARYCAPDDWRRQIRYRNDQVFFCPATRSIYSYEFNPAAYGVSLKRLPQPGQVPMECEAGFLAASPARPHRGGYNTTYCDGHGVWAASAAPGARRHR